MMIRLIIKSSLFCALCFSFDCLLGSNRYVCSIVSKLGLLFATCAVSWHILSYLWASYFSTRRNRTNPQSKCLLITGCDTGFGHITAISMCNSGFTVFAGCLDDKSPESAQLVQKCKDASKMHIIKLDVTKTSDIINARQLIEKHCEETGEMLHGLVNNAGISTVGPIEWGRIEEFQKILQVNLYGAIQVTRQFIPLLRKTPDARIIAMTSYITSAVSPLMSAYGISKVAVKSFFNGLREEIKNETREYSNIKTITIEPTIFKTQMLTVDPMVQSLEKMWSSSSESVQSVYTETFFEGIITFLQVWKIFEFLDFIALRRDISLVTEAISKALTTERPETNHRVIGLMGRASLSTVINFMPQEAIEVFYEIFGLVVIISSVQLAWFKKRYEKITGKSFFMGVSPTKSSIESS